MAMKRSANNRFSRWLCATEPSCNCCQYCYHRVQRNGSAGGVAKQRRRASANVAAVGDEEESYYPSVVRTVLAGGVVEVYSSAVPARVVMERHPGLCVARPEVFSRPLESLVGPKEKLLPGEKFYLVPYTTVRKLKQRQGVQRLRHSGVEDDGDVEGHLDLKAAMAADKGGSDQEGEEIDDEAKVLSAKDFYVSRERWRQCGARRRLLWEAGRRESSEELLPPPPPPPPLPPPPPPPRQPQVGRGGRRFVPLRRRKLCRKGLGWKPNLESIQEVSP